MVTLLRDHVAVTGLAPFEALAAASHPALYAKQIRVPCTHQEFEENAVRVWDFLC